MICGKKTICIAMTNSWDEKKKKTSTNVKL